MAVRRTAGSDRGVGRPRAAGSRARATGTAPLRPLITEP